MRRLSRGEEREIKLQPAMFHLGIYMVLDGLMGLIDHVGPKTISKKAEIERQVRPFTGPGRETIFTDFRPKFSTLV
jgi:hypothetical protein